MNYTISNEKILTYNDNEVLIFPKYTSQLINLANQNAQGTRPVVVGQMSVLFPDFTASTREITIDNWRTWYTEKFPDALDTATEKIFAQVQNLKNAVSKIDREMVMKWVEDLVINKTFNGMYIQKAILASLANIKGDTYRLASPAEEAAGIDGYVGETPYSIKPESYKMMGGLSEVIDVKIIYYIKVKNGLIIEVEDE